MAEGGLLAWKVQKVKLRGPVVSYSRISDPLPNPPKGMVWKKDEAREWKLVEDVPELPVHLIGHGCVPENVHDDCEIIDEGDVQSELQCKELALRKHNSSETDVSRKADNELVDGIDYVEHVVLPTDTLQGVCLRYKVSATKLRQINKFSGASLTLAPPKLIIPVNQIYLKTDKIRVQDRNSIHFKTQYFLSETEGVGSKEARAYLDLAGGDVDVAISTAREDLEWEKDQMRGRQENIQHRDLLKISCVHEGLPLMNSHLPRKKVCPMELG